MPFAYDERVNTHGPFPSVEAFTQFPEIAQTRCWLWLGSLDVYGYGWVRLGGKKIKVHRHTFFLKFGHYPEPCGLHKCDVRSCINPDHIFEGTRRQNWKDKEAKGRGNHAKGSKQGASKLSESIVFKIRALYAKGMLTHLSLAQRFGVNRVTITNLLNRRSWKHVH